MAETRMLPRSMPHSTGIERTTGQASRPVSPTGSNASSHVSAAPGVSSRTHDHVVKARNPSGVSNARGPAGLPQPPRGGGQDAKVQIIERPGSRGGPTSGPASVQIISRPGQAAQAQSDDVAGAFAGGGVPNLLTGEHMKLIGSLLEQYAMRTAAIGDQAATQSAHGALDALGQMLEALQSLPPQRGQAQAPAHQLAQAHAPIAPQPQPIAAQTSTTIVDRAPDSARASSAQVAATGHPAGVAQGAHDLDRHGTGDQ